MQVDFSNTGSVTSRMGYLTNGLHTASVLEYKTFDDSNRLYVYMQTEGTRHRESFNLERGLIFLKAFLVSAGVPEDKLSASVALDKILDKLINREVFFNYQAPELDSEGKRLDGSYPRYNFYPKKQFEMMIASRTPVAAQAAVADIAIEEPKEVATATPATTTTANNGSSDFDFLLDDE
jgi:hypothetical protein